MSRTTFDSKSKTIGELLGVNSRERIVVPTFQRGYEWGKKHVEAFWNDIRQFRSESELADSPEKYFLGPIVVLYQEKNITQLLDGQQRLATATILLSVIRDLANEIGTEGGTEFGRDTQTSLIEKEDGGYALQLGETDEAYFRDSIQKPVACRPKIRTHRNVKAARDLLFEKVKSEIAGANPQAALTVLKSWRATVRSDLVMACIPVESERDAFRIFETLNDRGLRLSVPDLLLNYLMREAPEADRKQIRQHWTDMVERMGRRDINKFFRHMWLSRYGDLKSTDLFSALKEHIQSKKIGSLTFVQSCSDECEYYVQLITTDKLHLGEATKYVAAILRDLNSQPALPVLLSAFQTLPPADFVTLCRWLLVFITRYSVIANLDASGLEAVFYNLAREIRILMTVSEEPDSHPPKSTDCLRQIKITLVKESPSDDLIRSSVAKLILDPSEAGYVLSRIAARMQTSTKEITIDEANLEHVFPKNPEENEWEGSANQEILEPLLWHIGNLTILGERLNNKVRNAEFSVKRPYYAKASELLMTQQIASDYAVWDEQSIKSRADRLTTLVLEVWNFQNPSRV